MHPPDTAAVAPTAVPSVENGSLRGRVASGASWNLIGALGTQVLGIARTAVLARLLSQGDFGIAGMALTVIGALYTLTSTGIVASIISSHFDDEEERRHYASSVWTLEIVRGALIALVLAILAVPMTRFYGEARLLPVLLVLSLTPIFTSLNNVGLTLQVQRIEFKKFMLHGLLSALLTTVFTIALAWWTRNYWALVWGQIAGAAVGTGLSFAFSSYRPRLSWNASHARRGFDFGKHVFLISLANYALTTMDNVLVGRLMGAAVLGSYVVAYSFCNLPRAFISNILGAILFPTFAVVGRENDAPRLNNVVARAFALCCAILTVFIPPLVAFAPAIVRVIYGTQWEEAIALVRLLLLAGFFSGVLSLLSTLAISLDRPRLESSAKIFDAAIFLLLLYPLILWLGAVGAAVAACISCLLAVLWRWLAMNHLAPQGFAPMPWLIASALGCGALAAFVGAGAAILISDSSLELTNPSRVLADIFSTRMPSLSVAWLQLIFGIPLVGLLSGALFSALHPPAREEVGQAFRKMCAQLKK